MRPFWRILDVRAMAPGGFLPAIGGLSQRIDRHVLGHEHLLKVLYMVNSHVGVAAFANHALLDRRQRVLVTLWQLIQQGVLSRKMCALAHWSKFRAVQTGSLRFQGPPFHASTQYAISMITLAGLSLVCWRSWQRFLTPSQTALVSTDRVAFVRV